MLRYTNILAHTVLIIKLSTIWNKMEYTMDPMGGENFEGHVGKVILKTLKANEDKIQQIEIISGLKETCGSVKRRSIQAAQAFKAKGLKLGDIIMICAVNHNDASIPVIAATYLGIIPINLVIGMSHSEIKHIANLANPKIIFTDPSMVDALKNVLSELNIDAEIVIFNSVDNQNCILFEKFLQENENDDDFICEEFDPETTTAFVVCSSGTTGLPKLVAITHKTVIIDLFVPAYYIPNKKLIQDSKRYLNFSPMYWQTGLFAVIGSCVYGIERIQCKDAFSLQNAKTAIELYKPDQMLLSPTSVHLLIKYQPQYKIDYSSLKAVIVGGSVMSPYLVKKFQELLPNGMMAPCYASTETWIITYGKKDFIDGKFEMIGNWFQWKIIDVDTGKKLGPNKIGELCLKSPTMFQKYYNDPEATANAFDDELYYKTGDLLYYDDNNNFYYVDRCKDILKYANFQISPAEIENKICSLPEVLNAGVVGVRDAIYGDLPKAFVQLIPGAILTAQQIKDVIKNSLSDQKQLRGGVEFVNKLPLTYSGKVNRKALKQMKHNMKPE